MLKFRQSFINSPPVEVLPQSFLHRKNSFSTSQLGHSKATVILQNLSLPLAWPIDEYFGEKKEWREFNVQIVLKSNTTSVCLFSKPKSVNRTFTDVEFLEDFVFPDEDSNFCIELNILCKRNNENSGSMVQAVTNSLGRSIGLSWRKYQQKEETKHKLACDTRFLSVKDSFIGAPNRSFLEDLRKFGIREELRETSKDKKSSLTMSSSSSKPFLSENQNNIIGYVRFRLANATLNGKTHSYVLEKTSNHLLPLYGNISVQLLVQPNSLISPLAQGSLDIFLTNEGILYQHMYCVLQGGQLRCWDVKVENEVLDSKQIMSKTPTICLQIIGKERIERTSFPTAFRILSDNKNLLCICLSKHSLIGWRNSIYLQQNDNIVWAEFAQIQHNPYSVAFGETSNNINVKDDNNNSNVKIINEQNNNQEIKKCNKNLYNNIENNKFENIKSTKQISHNYVLSLQINDINKLKKSYINEKINSEKTKEFKTTNYDEVNNNKIIKDKQERPFNINLDYYSNITQQKITRNKEKCFETWHSPKKSSDCTRL